MGQKSCTVALTHPKTISWHLYYSSRRAPLQQCFSNDGLVIHKHYMQDYAKMTRCQIEKWRQENCHIPQSLIAIG